MVGRATYARVKIALVGTDKVGVSQSEIEDLSERADNQINGYTYPQVISTTDDIAIEIAVDVVLRLLRIGDMAHEASGTSAHDGRSYPDIPVLTKELKARIDALRRSTSRFGYADMIG